MATLNLSLSDIQIPAISGYTPPIGTKKSNGGLSTQEVNDNIIAPFIKQRPIVITESSSTGTIEYNAAIAINSEGATLTLGNGGYVGCEVLVCAYTNGSVSFQGSGTGTMWAESINAGQYEKYIWLGTYWRSVGLHLTTSVFNWTFPDNAVTVKGYIFKRSNVVSLNCDIKPQTNLTAGSDYTSTNAVSILYRPATNQSVYYSIKNAASATEFPFTCSIYNTGTFYLGLFNIAPASTWTLHAYLSYVVGDY